MKAKIISGELAGTEFEVSDETIQNIKESTVKFGDILKDVYGAIRIVLYNENGGLVAYNEREKREYCQLDHAVKLYKYKKTGQNIFDLIKETK